MDMRYDVDVRKMNDPVLTKAELVKELRGLGLSRGMVLLVEVTSRRLPYVVAGEQALIEALMDVVGYDGTIVVPAFTPELLDPACVPGCPFPYECWEDIRRNSMPYQKKLSIPAHADPFVCQFLRNDAVVRSNHPLYSFAAWGKYAKVICSRHPLHFGLSDDSPLGHVKDLSGYVLLLGTAFEESCMHALAKYHSRRLPICIRRLPVEKGTSLFWKDILDYRMDASGLVQVCQKMEERKTIVNSYFGSGRITLFSAHEAFQVARHVLNP